ncbi:MAG: cobalamin-dependent protein [Bacteroidales bacterium]|nr:cobalamin-dependent protein [Bacteroidales bacterium]
MNKNSVVFIAFEQRENLGIGYMHAILSGAGYEVGIIDVTKDKAEILKELQELNPVLVGFSVIFENHIYDFQELIEYLRSKGIQSHFTAGGHFASLRPADLFEIAPSLDSMVRFEGEHTILDLANHLQQDKDWKKVLGISYRNKGALVNNQLRPLEPDLDAFPLPFRPEMKEYALDNKYATLLAGRGCIYNCAFCDIREFYGQAPGPVKRIRKPEKLVEEMEYLHKEQDCSVFLFQDDDFPLLTNRSSDWVKEFCMALRDKNLVGKILWKINCRPDEVDLELFELMKAHGLFKVYLGIEDGTDAGLKQMNKRLQVSDHMEGIQILKELGISIDYGFMLFQPSSTYKLVNENLAFLEQICQDGYMPVFFLKMMPYLATRIEKELREEGRLKGRPGFLDYDFYEQSMDDFYFFVSESFGTWFHGPGGLNNYSKWVVNYITVFNFFIGSTSEIERLTESILEQVADSNHFLIKTMKELSALFESGKYSMENDRILDEYRSSIEQKHSSALKNVSDLIVKIEVHHLTKDLFV